MYIRQECILSFNEILNFQPETRLQMILSQLDFSSIEDSLSKPSSKRGPKGHSVRPMLYSMIAMQVEKIPYVKSLVSRLNSDPVLRYNCGFDVLDNVPSASSFSRLIDKISQSPLLEKEFESIVIKAKSLNIIDGNEVAIDSTKLDSFESAKPKSKINDDGNSPNWGMKKDTNGNNIRWFGWKLHILADCASELPLKVMVTPANVYDGTVVIGLIKEFREAYGHLFNPEYFIMDSGYDLKENYGYIAKEINSQPIIALNQRGSYAPPEGMNEKIHPICSGGYELSYWGKDGNYLKFRCPHAVGKINCPHGMNWCTNSNYGYCLKVNYKEDNRFYSYPLRSSEKWQLIYNKRTSIERCNSRLKENLSVNNIRSAGINKAKTFALLNCIALIAGTIAVNKSKTLNQAA